MKNQNWFRRHWVLSILLGIFIMFFVMPFFLGIFWVIISNITGTANVINEPNQDMENPETKLTKSQIISQSITPNYESIFRHSENYEGEYIHIKGEVIQVLYDSNNKPSDLRVNTGICDYTYLEDEYCDDTYYLIFENYEGERILEGDVVDVYGIYDGLYSYESIFGETITIPKVSGLYVDIFS